MKRENELMIKGAKMVINKTFDNIENLIKGQDVLKTEGIDVTKINEYRDFITVMYMAEMNDGVLKDITIDTIFELLDSGFVNEYECDTYVNKLQFKYEFNPQLKIKVK